MNNQIKLTLLLAAFTAATPTSTRAEVPHWSTIGMATGGSIAAIGGALTIYLTSRVNSLRDELSDSLRSNDLHRVHGLTRKLNKHKDLLTWCLAAMGVATVGGLGAAVGAHYHHQPGASQNAPESAPSTPTPPAPDSTATTTEPTPPATTTAPEPAPANTATKKASTKPAAAPAAKDAGSEKVKAQQRELITRALGQTSVGKSKRKRHELHQKLYTKRARIAKALGHTRKSVRTAGGVKTLTNNLTQTKPDQLIEAAKIAEEVATSDLPAVTVVTEQAPRVQEPVKKAAPTAEKPSPTAEITPLTAAVSAVTSAPDIKRQRKRSKEEETAYKQDIAPMAKLLGVNQKQLRDQTQREDIIKQRHPALTNQQKIAFEALARRFQQRGASSPVDEAPLVLKVKPVTPTPPPVKRPADKRTDTQKEADKGAEFIRQRTSLRNELNNHISNMKPFIGKRWGRPIISDKPTYHMAKNLYAALTGTTSKRLEKDAKQLLRSDEFQSNLYHAVTSADLRQLSDAVGILRLTKGKA